MKNSGEAIESQSFGSIALLPDTAFTRSGIAFYPNEDVWDWLDGPFRLHADFSKVTGTSSSIRDALKLTLTVFAKGSSANHVINLFNIFKHFISLREAAPPLACITNQEISNYGARLQKHERWRIGTLNVLLQKWVLLGLEGVDPQCSRYLREQRKPGNEKGHAVRTRDPFNGPFSEPEYTALYKAVDAAYGTGEMPLWVVLLMRVLFACGGRISQYASLKVKDLVIDGDAFSLQLPQAKTRGAHARVSLKKYELSAQTGRLILQHVNRLKAKGHDDQAALFPESEIMGFKFESLLRSSEDMFFGHCTSLTLSRRFCIALKSIAPPSDRLDFEAVPISTRRFRYTFGTRLAEEGASKIVIADRLGHADLQSVDVYFEASPKIVENIDRAMDAQLAPLANAFRGRLIEDEAHSTHKGVLGSRIIDFRVSPLPVGSCGGKGHGCSFNKPVACYTCFKFEPWLDAPHERILHRLIKERTGFSGDDRMATVNDEAIRAVQQVMAECAQIHEQRGAGAPV